MLAIVPRDRTQPGGADVAAPRWPSGRLGPALLLRGGRGLLRRGGGRRPGVRSVTRGVTCRGGRRRTRLGCRARRRRGLAALVAPGVGLIVLRPGVDVRVELVGLAQLVLVAGLLDLVALLGDGGLLLGSLCLGPGEVGLRAELLLLAL